MIISHISNGMRDFFLVAKRCIESPYSFSKDGWLLIRQTVNIGEHRHISFIVIRLNRFNARFPNGGLFMSLPVWLIYLTQKHCE